MDNIINRVLEQESQAEIILENTKKEILEQERKQELEISKKLALKKEKLKEQWNFFMDKLKKEEDEQLSLEIQTGIEELKNKESQILDHSDKIINDLTSQLITSPVDQN